MLLMSNTSSFILDSTPTTTTDALMWPTMIAIQLVFITTCCKQSIPSQNVHSSDQRASVCMSV